ncbi:hypothetical protein [Flagellimonas meishanensis]|uniref:hypothetical protein n=1 Tax=Flagellimonas meishanensis TaxID=2873264 RepID=UPI001CA74A90|nr:hypothetical protein [[Muricauda] meishanensis]
MKPLLLVLFVLFGNSCNQEDNTSPTENPITEAVKNENGGTPPPTDQLLGPNEVLLKISILETTDQSKEICGLSKEFIFHVEVVEVIKTGGSVNKKFSKNEKMDVAFLFEPESLNANMTLEVKAKEGLCPDTSNSYFTIIEHRILE